MKATRILFVAAVLGCGDRMPTNVSRQLLLAGPPSVGLVRCLPLAPDSVSETIGPLGGVLQVGPHRLSIPPGALDAPVEITAIVPADTVNRVHFEPQGLRFQQPASLSMSYANCGVGATLAPKQIAYTGDALVILTLLPTADDRLSQTVIGQLEHFSDYAIAW